MILHSRYIFNKQKKYRIYGVHIFIVALVAIYMNTTLGVGYAQEANSSSSDTSSDTSSKFFDTWRVALVGVQIDDFDNLSPEQQHAVFTFISLLRVILKQADTRHLSTYEYYLAREFIKTATLESLREKLENIRIKLDIDALSSEKKETWIKRFNARKEVRKVQKNIKKISKIKVTDVPLDNILDVRYIEQSEYTTIPLTPDFRMLANALNAQQIFYFTLNMVAEYMVITVYSYNIILDASVEVMKTTVDPTNIQAIQNSMSNTVQAAVLGYPVGALTIRTVTISQDGEEIVLNDASIILDGELVGFGEVQINNLWVGVHSIIVLYNDQQRTLTMSLLKDEKAMRTVIFDSKLDQTITINTNPSDAKVYINSEWVGNTPLVLVRTLKTKQLEIKYVGYITARISLTRNTPAIIKIPLILTNAIPLKRRLKKSRDQFYTAFSIFAVSLALPVVLNGFYLSETAALLAFKKGSRITSGEFTKASTKRDALYYSYIGTAVLSGALSIYAFVELSRYLKVASEYHER